MNDTISRAAAIDALRKMQTYKMSSGDDMLLIDQAGAQTELMLLPPAEPMVDIRDTQYNLPISTDCISRRAAINAIDECYSGGEDSCGEPWIYKENAVEAINMIEPIPPAEPKRGTWIDRGERGDWEWQADGRGKHWHEWECNICHHYFAERSFFCPHCGSDMRKVTT